MVELYYEGGGFYEEEDLDFLLSEDCQNFIYEASAQVKQSFLSRIATKIKTMFQKIRNFFTSSAAKKQAEQLKNAVDENPELAKQKIQIEDYESQYKLGKRALAKIKKAKSKEEADQIVAQYQASRKRRKIVTITVGAALTAVIGGTLYARAKTKMAEIEEDLPYAKLDYLKASKEHSEIVRDNAKKRQNIEYDLDTRLKTGRTQKDKEDYEAAKKKAFELGRKYSDEENKAFDKMMPRKEEYNTLLKQREAGVLGLMAQDVRDQVMKPIEAIKRAVGKGPKTETPSKTPKERPSERYKRKEEEQARQSKEAQDRMDALNKHSRGGDFYGNMANAFDDLSKIDEKELKEVEEEIAKRKKKK